MSCSVCRCKKKILARGMCGTCYGRWRKSLNGAPMPPLPARVPPVCTINGCERRAEGRGWCDLHYRRWLRTGDPLHTTRIIGDDDARFWSKVDKNGPNGCWEWLGSHTSAGYGNFGRTNGGTAYAHRFAYELLVGPIPEKRDIDHLCRNRGCCNPEHLEAVPHLQNIRRGIKGKLTTHCPHGHPYDEANTYVDAKGWRTCRTCRREGMRRKR